MCCSCETFILKGYKSPQRCKVLCWYTWCILLLSELKTKQMYSPHQPITLPEPRMRPIFFKGIVIRPYTSELNKPPWFNNTHVQLRNLLVSSVAYVLHTPHFKVEPRLLGSHRQMWNSHTAPSDRKNKSRHFYQICIGDWSSFWQLLLINNSWG